MCYESMGSITKYLTHFSRLGGHCCCNRNDQERKTDAEEKGPIQEVKLTLQSS